MHVKRTRGVTLFYVLIVITILFVMVGAMTAIGIGNLDMSMQDNLDKQAYYAANAGAESALLSLKGAPSYTPSPNPTGTPSAYTSLPNNYGRYAITMTNNYQGSSTMTAPNGISVPPNFVYILSYGQDAAGRVTREVGLLAKAGHMFDYGVFGKDSIKLGGGAKLDSFNSNNATYANTPTATRQNAANLNVGTDGTQAAVVSIDGSTVHVYGSVDAGPGADVNTAFALNGETISQAISGSAGTLFAAINLPVVTVPTLNGPGGPMPTSGVIPTGSYSSLTLASHGSITLKANSATDNTYYITGDVKLSGNSTINIDSSNGPVKLYFAGKFDISGGTVVNPSLTATNFQIYGTATAQTNATDANLTGGSTSTYTFYAPNSNVKIVGGSDFYGAVVGNAIDDSGGSNIHFDLATESLSTVIIFTLAGWQRY